MLIFSLLSCVLDPILTIFRVYQGYAGLEILYIYQHPFRYSACGKRLYGKGEGEGWIYSAREKKNKLLVLLLVVDCSHSLL
jgi:hypothetical protein